MTRATIKSTTVVCVGGAPEHSSISGIDFDGASTPPSEFGGPEAGTIRPSCMGGVIDISKPLQSHARQFWKVYTFGIIGKK